MTSPKLELQDSLGALGGHADILTTGLVNW